MIDFDEVRRQVPLSEFLISLGLGLSREGNTYRARCPLRRAVRPETILLRNTVSKSADPDTALERARRRVMPFGKHRGRKLDAIEPSYLRWALRECSNLSLGLREAIKIVLEGGSGRD
jgi:uncharacterized protein (DUF3820 family)